MQNKLDIKESGIVTFLGFSCVAISLLTDGHSSVTWSLIGFFLLFVTSPLLKISEATREQKKERFIVLTRKEDE